MGAREGDQHKEELRERGQTIDLRDVRDQRAYVLCFLEAGSIREVVNCDTPLKMPIDGVRVLLEG